MNGICVRVIRQDVLIRLDLGVVFPLHMTEHGLRLSRSTEPAWPLSARLSRPSAWSSHSPGEAASVASRSDDQRRVGGDGGVGLRGLGLQRLGLLDLADAAEILGEGVLALLARAWRARRRALGGGFHLEADQEPEQARAEGEGGRGRPCGRRSRVGPAAAARRRPPWRGAAGRGARPSSASSGRRPASRGLRSASRPRPGPSPRSAGPRRRRRRRAPPRPRRRGRRTSRAFSRRPTATRPLASTSLSRFVPGSSAARASRIAIASSRCFGSALRESTLARSRRSSGDSGPLGTSPTSRIASCQAAGSFGRAERFSASRRRPSRIRAGREHPSGRPLGRANLAGRLVEFDRGLEDLQVVGPARQGVRVRAAASLLMPRAL